MGKAKDHSKYHGYYEKYNRHYYWKNREEILRERRERYENDPSYRAARVESTRKWAKANPRKAAISRRNSVKRYFSKLRADWGKSNYEIGKQAEVLAVEKILPSLGFSNILYLPDLGCRIFFDILAKKDGVKYGIQVKTQILAGLRSRRQRPIYDFLGLPCLILFVKPSLDYYRLIKASKTYFAMITSKKRLVAEGKIN